MKLISLGLSRCYALERERERWPFYFFCRFVEINSNFFLWSDSFRRLGGGESQSCSYCINSNWSIQSDQENGDYLVETISIRNSISKKKKTLQIIFERCTRFENKIILHETLFLVVVFDCWFDWLLDKNLQKKKLKLTVA